MRALLYCRLNNAPQLETVWERQETLCREVAERLGYTDLHALHDLRNTWTQDSPLLTGEIDLSLYDAVITTNPTRISRKQKQLTAVMAHLKAAGIKLIFAENPEIDSELLGWLLGQAAQYERTEIARRQRTSRRVGR